MKLVTAADALSDYQGWATQPDNRVRLGLPGLEKFRGVAPGEVCQLLARPSVGKTNLLMNVLCNNLDTRTLVVSLEMPARQLVPRMVAISYDLYYRDIEAAVREGDEETLALLGDAAYAFHKVSFLEEAGVGVLELGHAVAQYEPKLVVIDYLELLQGGGDALTHVNETSKQLKVLAKEYGVAVIVLHQVGRGEGGAGWKPLSLTSGRYGGEEAADYIFGMYRPSLDPEMDDEERLFKRGEVVVQWLKNRDGVLGSDVRYVMDEDTLRMELPHHLNQSDSGKQSDRVRMELLGATSPSAGDGAKSSPAAPGGFRAGTNQDSFEIAPSPGAPWPKDERGQFAGQLNITDALERARG